MKKISLFMIAVLITAGALAQSDTTVIVLKPYPLPQGDVLIQGANIEIQGGNVTLYPGTTIVNSNVTINRRE